jgi:hypothetical protein
MASNTGAGFRADLVDSVSASAITSPFDESPGSSEAECVVASDTTSVLAISAAKGIVSAAVGEIVDRAPSIDRGSPDGDSFTEESFACSSPSPGDGLSFDIATDET